MWPAWVHVAARPAFDVAPHPGNAQVRIAGKIAGTVTSVQPGPDVLRVNASLSGQYAPLGRGASVHIGVLLGTSLVDPFPR